MKNRVSLNFFVSIHVRTIHKIILLFYVIAASSVHVFSQKYYPAGLGNTNLKLWLTVSDATTLINPSSAQAANGDFIKQWTDKSGAGANAVQATGGSQPVYNTNQLNGFGAVIFQNTSEYMTGASGAYQTIVSVRSMLGAGVHYQYLFSSPANTDFSIRGTGGSSGTTYTDGPNTNDWCYNTGTTPTQWINGVQSLSGSTVNHILVDASLSATNATYSLSSTFLTRGMYANDPVFELLAYNTTLTTTQRRLLENYEASEWGLTSYLPTSSYTVFTPPSSSTYNRNLVGIGYTTVLDNFVTNPAGSTDGLGFSTNILTGFLNTTGYIMAAHNGQANTVISNAVINNVSGNTNLWNRSWYLQKSGGTNAGVVTLNFNFNDYSGTTPSGAYSYGILYNATDGTFATGTNQIVSTTSTTVSGNIVSFATTGTNLSNGYYTIVWSTFGPLAIVLDNFEVKKQAESNILKWSTAAGSNCNYFEIQRSQTGTDFTALGIVKAKQQSAASNAYNFTDANPFAEWNYYRLKMVDANGTVTFSEIKTVYFNNNNRAAFNIYPNPVTDYLQLTSSTISGPVQVQIINTGGKIIESINATLYNTLHVSVRTLNKGIYFVRITDAANTSTYKIIKQ